MAHTSFPAPNERAFSGEPSEHSERPERMRGRRVRCNAMLGGRFGPDQVEITFHEAYAHTLARA